MNPTAGAGFTNMKAIRHQYRTAIKTVLPDDTTKLRSFTFFLDSLNIDQLNQLYFMLRLDERKRPES
jgi:hypothetical protein